MNSPTINNARNAKEASRPWMLSLTLGDKNTAASLYMPFIKGGGVFIESDKEYNLGDPVFVLLTVGDDAKKFPINGKVVWICGANARGDKARGIGVQFPKDDSGEGARVAIEQMIGKMQNSMKKNRNLVVFTDSHCHLDFPGLVEQLPDILSRMKAAQVSRALCISVQLEDFPNVLALAENHDNLWATAGVHPDYEDITEPSVEKLLELADHPRVIGIGETGLDYFRLKGDLEWQRERFRVHLRAANVCKKPVIVHTRAAGDDTLRILQEENVQGCGGVIHCFTETLDFARKALDMGMYLSFSGIVSFKNAADLREVARFAPLDRILIETDSPYLAPVPHRGKTNEPSFVPYVAKAIAVEKTLSVEEVGLQTSTNFDRLFGLKQDREMAG